MAPEPNDAWMQLPPLDGLVDILNGPPETGELSPHQTLGFSMYLKGTQAIFVVEGGDERLEVKFRYRRRARAWQMFNRVGSRWVSDGPPGERAGRSLEKIVRVLQGSDPYEVFGSP